MPACPYPLSIAPLEQADACCCILVRASANNRGGDRPLSHRIEEQLLYSLHAHSNNWPTQIQNRALALLRSGDVQTFPALLRQILEEVRKETALEPSSRTAGGGGSANGNSSSNGNSSETVQVNGSGSGPGGKKAAANGSSAPGPGEASNLHTNTSTSLAVPQAVVDDALRVTKEALMAVADFDEENGAT